MKKLLTLTLCLVMLLGIFPAMDLTGFAYTDFTITPYQNPATGVSGFENWKGPNGMQTQLLICTEAFPQGIDHSIPWTITLYDVPTMETQTFTRTPDSGSGHWLYRFELLTADEGIEIDLGARYMVEARVTVGGKEYVGAADNFRVIQSPIYPEGKDNNNNDTPEPTDTTEIFLTPLFGAWENWENSPNKGDEWAVTQLLVGIKDAHGNVVDIPEDADWTVTIEDMSGLVTKTLKLAPATKALVYDGLYRFETVLGDGNDRFIPEESGIYYVKIEAKTDTTHYASDLTGGFICNVDPIIPDSVPNDISPLAITGKFVNTTYYNLEFFCLQLKIVPYHEMALTPSWYNYTCTVTLTDTNGKTYTLTEDDLLYQAGDYHYFLLETLDGIEKGMTYTVSFSSMEHGQWFESRDDIQVTCNIEPPVSTEEETSEIKIAPVGDGWVNMKVDGKEVTRLLLKITDKNGNVKKLDLSYLYEFIISDGSFTHYIYLEPVHYDNGVYHFEPINDSIYDWYIPEKGGKQKITLSVYDIFGELLYESKETSGFVCNVDPIIPDDFGTDWVITPMNPAWSMDENGDLLLRMVIEDMDGKTVENNAELMWGMLLGIKDNDEYFEVFDLTVLSEKDGVFTFKVETEGTFIPEKNVNYVVSIMASDESFEETHESAEVEGFITKTDLKKPANTDDKDDEKENDKDDDDTDIFEGLFENEKEKDKGPETWVVIVIAAGTGALAAAIATLVTLLVSKKKNRQIPQNGENAE